MAIIHNPVANTEAIINHFSDWNTTVTYVCTRDLYRAEEDINIHVDIFHQWPKDPVKLNTYFGYWNANNQGWYCDADNIEDYTFAMVPNANGDLEYSQTDTPLTGDVRYYRISNGEFQEV
jgi:hypothetical protein